MIISPKHKIINLFLFFLTTNFAEIKLGNLCELWDIAITVRLTRKTEYESLPNGTINLFVNIFDNRPKKIIQYNFSSSWIILLPLVIYHNIYHLFS